jgi:DinB superfamily
MNDDLKDLLATLEWTPVEIARLVNDLPPSQLAVRPSPDDFSVLENVCHLRDLEIEGYAVRIQRMLAEDCPTLADFDGTRVAMERDYNKQNLSEALAEFTLARRRNLALMQNMADDRFDRNGLLEGVGEISLSRLLEMMVEHDEGHLDDLRRNSRLAKSAQR